MPFRLFVEVAEYVRGGVGHTVVPPRGLRHAERSGAIGRIVHELTNGRRELLGPERLALESDAEAERVGDSIGNHWLVHAQRHAHHRHAEMHCLAKTTQRVNQRKYYQTPKTKK